MESDANGNDTGVQYIDLGDDITFNTNTPLLGAITMSRSDSEKNELAITLAFVANVSSDSPTTLNIISNKDGDLYYIVLLASDDVLPSPADVIARGIGIAKGTATLIAERLETVVLTGLQVDTGYIVYVVVADELDQEKISTVTAISFNENKNPPEEEEKEEKEEKEEREISIGSEESDAYSQSLANISQLRLRIQNIKDISTLNLDKSIERISNMTSSMQLSDIFIDLLVREHGIEKFTELVSISKNLDGIEFSLAFERIYGQSFANWYIQSAALQIITEFELSGLNSSLSRITELSTFQSVSTPGKALTAQSEVLQKSIDKVLLDSLMSNTSGFSLSAVFLDLDKNYPRSLSTKFKFIYGYTFEDWYLAAGKLNLAKNLGITSYTAQLHSDAGLNKFKVSRN